MRNSTTAAVAALIAAGVGALAIWQYKRLSPERKHEFKAHIDEAGNKIMNAMRDMENSIKDKYDKVIG